MNNVQVNGYLWLVRGKSTNMKGLTFGGNCWKFKWV